MTTNNNRKANKNNEINANKVNSSVMDFNFFSQKNMNNLDFTVLSSLMYLYTVLYLHEREDLIDFCEENQGITVFCFIAGLQDGSKYGEKYDFKGIIDNDPKTIDEAGVLFASINQDLPEDFFATLKDNFDELASIYAWGFFLQSLEFKNGTGDYILNKHMNASESTKKIINDMVDYFMNEIRNLK